MLIRRAPESDTSRERAYVLCSPTNLEQFAAELAAETGLAKVPLSAEGDPRNASEASPATLWVAPLSIREEIVTRVAARHRPDWGWSE